MKQVSTTKSKNGILIDDHITGHSHIDKLSLKKTASSIRAIKRIKPFASSYISP